MYIAEKIAQLRKQKGLSQEALAEAVGVSRQAVSKWESGQSIPDIDKVLLLSDYFGVSTDALLKGEESAQTKTHPLHAKIFVLAASACNWLGLAAACAIWYELQNAFAVLTGVILMALGCTVFCIGMLKAASSEKEAGISLFWCINIWPLLLLPLSLLFNLLLGGTLAPYPLLFSPVVAFLLFWALYFAVCIFIAVKQAGKLRQK